MSFVLIKCPRCTVDDGQSGCEWVMEPVEPGSPIFQCSQCKLEMRVNFETREAIVLKQ